MICSVAYVSSIALTDFVISNTGSLSYESPATALHVDGNQLKDASNRVVYLRGVNQPGFVDSPTGFWRPEGGSTFSGLDQWNPEAVKANLDEMKSWGINVIRCHQVGRHWVDNTRVYQGSDIGQAYKNNLHDIIAYAGERGFYYIFDYYSDEGYPNDHQDELPFQPYSDLFSRTEFVQYWYEVAEDLKGYSNVLFEIFNEPHGPNKDTYFSLANDCIAAIRSAGAEQPIIIQWGYSIWTNLDYPHNGVGSGTMDWVIDYPISDDNIVYSTHVYRGAYGHIHDSSGYLYAYDHIKAGLIDCGVQQVAQQYPVLIGEFGAYHPSSSSAEVEFFKNIVKIGNEWGLHYTAWCWTVPAHMGFAVLQDGTWIPPPNEAGQELINGLGGSTSLKATVTPYNPTVYQTTSIDLKVTAGGGTPPYYYNWKEGGTTVGSSSTHVFEGSTHALGDYEVWCEVSDSQGRKVESNKITVHVVETPPPQPFSWNLDATSDSTGNWRPYHGTLSVSADAYEGSGSLRFEIDAGQWDLWAEKEAPWGTTTWDFWNWGGLSTITFAFKTNNPQIPISFAVRCGSDWHGYRWNVDTSPLTHDAWHVLSVDLTQPDNYGNYVGSDLTQIVSINFRFGSDDTSPSDGYSAQIDIIEGA